MQIEKKYKDRIAKYAKKIDVNPTELETKFASFLDTESSIVVAWNKFYGNLVREEGSLYGDAPNWLGYVFGDTGIIDFVEQMADKSTRLYNDPKRREKAIDDKIVDRSGVPLDYRPTIFGRPNPTFGEPLEGHSYARRLTLISGEIPDFTNLQITELSFSGDLAEYGPSINLHRFYKFRARPFTKDKSNVRNLNAGKVTKLKPYNTDLRADELVYKLGDIFKLGELDNLWSLKFSDKNVKYPDPVLIEANVADMNTQKSETRRNFSFLLKDYDVDDINQPALRCYMPPRPVEFLVDSRLFFAGRLRKSTYNGKERMILNALGYIPIHGLTFY